MRLPILIRTLLLVAPLLARPLAAQIPLDDCVDRAGRPVRGVVDNSLGWAGAATVVNGESIIYWNAKANARADRTTRIFIYLHECGHHRLGHVWKGRGGRWEIEAECWAVQQLLERGFIQTRHLSRLEEQLGRYPGDPYHLGGHARMKTLRDCVAAKTDPLHWSAALRAFIDASETGFDSIRGQAVPRPSSETGIYESLVDLPGTYDCEITRERDVRCPVYTAKSAKRADERFELLARIIRGAVPDEWKTLPPDGADSTIVREYAIGDQMRRPRIRLLVTSGNRVVFVVHEGRQGERLEVRGER